MRGAEQIQRSRAIPSIIATIAILAAITTLAATITSCGNVVPSGTTAIEIVFGPAAEMRAAPQTLVPPVALEPVEYTVSGTGPETGEGPAGFEVTTSEESCLIDSVVLGDWSIEVVGFNASGETILVGGLDLAVSGPDPIVVPLTLPPGNGSVSIEVSTDRPPDLLPVVTAIDVLDVVFELEVTGSHPTYTATGDLGSGSYRLEVALPDETGEPLTGAVDALFVFPGTTTTGLISVHLPPEPTVTATVGFAMSGILPRAIHLVLQGDALFLGSVIAARVECDSDAAGSISWFVNGRETTSESDDPDRFEYTPVDPGLYRVDSLLRSDGRTVGADSGVVAVIEPETYGPFAYLETVYDNSGGIDGISGARSCVLDPSGTTLYVAGYEESSIAVFEIDSVSLRPAFVDRIRDASLDGVTSLAVSPDGMTLAAGTSQGFILLYSISDGAIPVVPTVFDIDVLSGVTVDGLADLAFGPDGDLHAVASATDTLISVVATGDPGSYQVTARDLSVLEGAAPVVEPISIDVSPDGAWFAVSGRTSDSVTILLVEDGSVAAQFSNGSSGLDGLNGGGGVRFAPDGAGLLAVGYYDDSLVRFCVDPVEGWYPAGRTESEVGGAFGFHYPRSVATSPDGSLAVVVSSGGRLIAFFSVPDEPTAPIFIDAAIDGIGRVAGLDGARGIALHPSGDAIYLVASNDSSLATFVRR